MIGAFLKKLRNKKGMTLRQLDEKVEVGVGNLSNYENGKIKLKDSTLLRILIEGYDYGYEQAWEKIFELKQKDLQEKRGLKLAQKIDKYDKSKTNDDIGASLKKQGFSEKDIIKIKKIFSKFNKC